MTPNAIVGRLQSLAQARGVPTDKLLSRWVGDGYLARLASSDLASRIVLKGANLFTAWDGDMLRPTRDINLHFLEEDRGHAQEMLRKIALTTIAPCDEIHFEPSSMRFETFPNPRTHGVQMSLDASVGRTVTPLKVNAAFGNSITPGTELRWYPRLLHGFECFPIRTYPRETVIAEKLATAVEHGRSNTRLRDYYDIWYISHRHHFLSHVLCEAIENTFAERNAYKFLQSDSAYWLAAFSNEFVTPTNCYSWNKWVEDQAPTADPPEFSDLIAKVAEFVSVSGCPSCNLPWSVF